MKKVEVVVSPYSAKYASNEKNINARIPEEIIVLKNHPPKELPILSPNRPAVIEPIREGTINPKNRNIRTRSIELINEFTPVLKTGPGRYIIGPKKYITKINGSEVIKPNNIVN
jgi:hypothetical protein